MANSFGTLFRITTWGESHGPAIGVVIDGCPPNLPLTPSDIDAALARRRPGLSPYTSPRQEPDTCELLSGVYENRTTGAPISILIRNVDARPSVYEPLHRPGHATYTYAAKYGHFDPRGGGRASARETAARVAAGAVATKLLATASISVSAAVTELGGSPHPAEWPALLDSALADGDSLGAIITGTAQLPIGLGDPTYYKLEALLASAMLSIPATKGFEIGHGFESARMRGSTHNDAYPLTTNHAGGTLGGISTGQPLHFRVAFKPTSSIRQPQQTLSFTGEPATLSHSTGHRHDPCVALRAVPIVEAMTALVLADCLLYNRTLCKAALHLTANADS